MDESKRPDETDDDAYIIEDTGESIEDLEREMEATAQEAVAATEERPEDGGLSDEAQQFRDRYMRAIADFENFRKRSEREKTEFYKYAMAGVLKDLLPVLDNFDRALDHAEEGDDFHKGVLLIYKQLFSVLQKHGVRTIEESGVKFDPNIHEAVVREEDDSVPSHTVTAVLQKGYFLHDRLLRPAMVKVAVGGPE
jgi:molecular chaperone GrpE